MLGEPATVNLTSINAKINQWSPSHCRVINCELRETDGPAIILGGYDNHIENCLFERIDWTGTTGHGYNIDVRNAPGLKFRRNTVRNTGGCEGVSCPRSVKTLEKNGDYEETEPWLTAPYVTYDDLFPTLIELNRLYDMGKVQSDGAHVDAGSYRIPGMMFRYNWAYRSDKNGLRFDGGGGWNNAPPGVEGTQHHNVVFGTRKLSCKGDRHFCFNNTCFDGSQQDIYVGGNYPRFNAFNSRSKVGNNACNTMSYSFNGENGKVPGELVSNFIGGLEGTDVKSLLVDVAQFDFRPRDMGGSGTGNANPLIDKGTVEHGYTVKHFESFLAEEVMVPGPSGSGRVPSGNVLMFNEGITDGYKGSAPDIGAYEYDSDLYWIPGRKEKKASSPIPGDGAKDMPLGRDLIFLNGYRAQSADIYLGTDSMAVAKADRSKVEFLVSKDDPRNIVDPAKYGKHLKPNTKYFWRVDAVGENGTERGDLWSFTTGAVAVNAVETKPNIIFVMTDDQGYGDLACHGHPFLKTPNLDRLYEQSARFTDYHVSPTCSPTRAALMSGRIPFEVGITHTILERERMALGVPTVAEILQKAGYTTGIFGKWHLGEEDTYQPHMRGFDEVFIHGAGGIGQNYPGSQSDAPGTSYFNPIIRYNNVFEQTQGYCTDVFMRQALGWIKQNADKPFFAYIPFNAPHAPLKVEEKYKAMYRDKCSDQNVAAFLGMITNIDENMGLLMQKLDEWNLAENTLLIFSTDNGSSRGWVIFNAGMTGKKGSINRGGSRVPLLFRLPGLTKAGVDIDRLTRHIDIFPTLADLAGADISNLDLQGRSLLPLLKNPRVDWPDRYTVFHVGRWAKKGMETFVRYSGPADPDENNFIQSPVSKDPGRRDPSDIIKVGDVYYIWYTKGKLRHGYDATIWYATSPDGHTWTEKGEALVRGSVGRWDEQSVFTPSILVAEGKYWLYFTAVPKPFDEASTKSGIGMAVSDSPDGPWKKLAVNPILLTSDDPDKFDSMRVDDACLVVSDGKYWMYYKGRQIDKFPKNL